MVKLTINSLHMNKSYRSLPHFIAFVLCAGAFLDAVVCSAQAEFTPWGNLVGIRNEGQLTKFQTSVVVIQDGWKTFHITAKEVQRPKYHREGTSQHVVTKLGQVDVNVDVNDAAKGEVRLAVSAKSEERVPLDGVYVVFSLSAFTGGQITIDNKTALKFDNDYEKLKDTFPAKVSSLSFRTEADQVTLQFKEPAKVVVPSRPPNAADGDMHLLVAVDEGVLEKEEVASVLINITASSKPDTKVASLTLDPTQEGRVFDGFGGNFRLQNPLTDPLVIDYCLKNMRIAWGRVEMPWSFWQPEQNANPRDSAKAGKIHPRVKDAMAMAKRLKDEGMPVILSAWSAPKWAVVGEPRSDVGPDGLRGNPLREEAMADIYRSIADYIEVMKDLYGVEVVMFSFNESDLGINIRQTGEEHADLIKGLGKFFKERGLKTTLLLGDNSDANTYTFIDPALNDPSTHPYIGAVSFHSWRGWEKETLEKWDAAATKLGKPLIVGEGSIDAQAWGYPNIFEEPSYALEEINLYVRILDICEPASILQWQLTADYSPLAGAGIFGKQGPLRPTQRFYNLQQLASTPANVRALPASSDHPDVSFAAQGNRKTGRYAMHMVNKGSERTVVITGIPTQIKSFRAFVTDKDRGAHELKAVPVNKGKASLQLPPGSYVSLMN